MFFWWFYARSFLEVRLRELLIFRGLYLRIGIKKAQICAISSQNIGKQKNGSNLHMTNIVNFYNSCDFRMSHSYVIYLAYHQRAQTREGWKECYVIILSRFGDAYFSLFLINFPDAFYQFANHHYCSHFDKHHINFYFQSHFLSRNKKRKFDI